MTYEYRGFIQEHHVVRGSNSLGECWFRRDSRGDWWRTPDHKGPWIFIMATEVPVEVLRLVNAQIEVEV
jgi:hypothetical protein